MRLARSTVRYIGETDNIIYIIVYNYCKHTKDKGNKMNILNSKAIKSFINVADMGWQMGWHEINGGNMSYRMTDDEVNEIKEHFNFDGEWKEIGKGVSVPDFSGQYFIITGSGKYFQNIKDNPEDSICIVTVDETGKNYKVVWGLVNGGRPTSEISAHLLTHSIKSKATGGKYRVVYHSHPKYTNILTYVLPLKSEVFTRELWEMMTECSIVFPNGVGVMEWKVPCCAEIGIATGKLMEQYDAVIWAHHGLVCSGETLDMAFGVMHTIEKAAGMLANVMQLGGKRQTIIPSDFKEIAHDFNLNFNEKFLYEK